MALERLAQEASGSREVAPFAEPELDGIAIAVDGAIQVVPLAADLDVCLINMPFAADGTFAPIEPLKEFW